MRIGDLRNKVTLEKFTRAPDGMGGFVNTYSAHDTAWAAIWPLNATERIQAAQNNMIVTHRIRIRFRYLLNPQWRIKYGDKYYSIEGIMNKETKNKMLEILANETKIK